MIRVRQVRIDYREDNIENIKKYVSGILGCREADIEDIKIIKKSFDCRKKPVIYCIYEINAKVKNEETILKKNRDINVLKAPEEISFSVPRISSSEKIHIIGAGPAGLFAAYVLSAAGLKPVVIERGKRVEDREKDVESFWKTNILNPSSNVQYGEGGAGTFSDGKLNTLIKDKESFMGRVFEIFVECGASPEILYVKNPHIGTDVLKKVVINLRNRIIENGGEFIYEKTLTDIKTENGRVSAIVLDEKETVAVDRLILAVGNSSRDTFEMLSSRGFSLEAKPFAIGVRIQHSQEKLNINQYGKNYDRRLPAANYKLTAKSKSGKGVFTFCMCPGGYVVNASSEEGQLVVNGMSYSKRDGINANSAVVVTIDKADYGDSTPLDGIYFQEKLERKAYAAADGKIPVQRYEDLKKNRLSRGFGEISPAFRGQFAFANINDILPESILEPVIEGIEAFAKKIPFYNDADAIIAAVETRTSSPVRIIRDECFESNIKGIYPAGEGAGYAGGITTSAIDGMKVALDIIRNLENQKE